MRKLRTQVNPEIYRKHAENVARIIAAGLSTGKDGPSHELQVKKAICLYFDIVNAEVIDD